MSNQNPDQIPEPNAWQKRGNGSLIAMLALFVGVLFVLVGVTAYATYKMGQATNPTPLVIPPAIAPPLPPQPYIEVTETTSTGGVIQRKGSAEGASIALAGDKVDGKDLKIAPTSISLGDLGSITGGAFEGSITVTQEGQSRIRLLGLMIFLVCGGLAFYNFKKNPLDWHFWGGLGVASIGGFAIMCDPMLLWYGLAAVGAGAIANFLPSIMAGKLLEAGKSYEDFVNSDSDVKAKWTAYRATTVPQSDKNTIAVIQKANT